MRALSHRHRTLQPRTFCQLRANPYPPKRARHKPVRRQPGNISPVPSLGPIHGHYPARISHREQCRATRVPMTDFVLNVLTRMQMASLLPRCSRVAPRGNKWMVQSDASDGRSNRYFENSNLSCKMKLGFGMSENEKPRTAKARSDSELQPKALTRDKMRGWLRRNSWSGPRRGPTRR